MILETTVVQAHEMLSDRYRVLACRAPGIAGSAMPGQFVHLSVPNLESAVLRRPFSVYKASGGAVSIMYKSVGAGTRAMTKLLPGDQVSLMGPLGNGFPPLQAGSFPVLVAGGYGAAALRLFAERSFVKGIAFLGASCAENLVCTGEFQRCGWATRITTEDGSAGARGLIIEELDKWRAVELDGRSPEFFACGPIGMLESVAERAVSGGWRAWLSMEQHMGCGVGACLGCVQKAKNNLPGAEADDGRPDRETAWKWARVCSEGPVFECRDIVWERHGERQEDN